MWGGGRGGGGLYQNFTVGIYRLQVSSDHNGGGGGRLL